MAAVLLPPNATPLERDLEQSMAIYGDEREVLVDTLWDPYRCPLHLLPWLAWALAVRRWDPEWPEATRREAIARAVERHRMRGTLGAIEAVLDDVGAIADIEENPNDVPFTMAIRVYNSSALLGRTTVAALKEYIDDAKRFSVHYDLSLAASLAVSFIPIAAGVAGVSIADFALEVDVAPAAPVPNQLPTANAGADQDVAAGANVELDGSGSFDLDGSIATYAWSQTSGGRVQLTGANTATPSFTAPSTSSAQRLTFELTVTDDQGGEATATVNVDVAAVVPVRYRFDTYAALQGFATFAEGSAAAGRWAVDQGGSTQSSNTGPGTNSDGPYAHTETSSSTFTEIGDNSPLNLDVESNWPAATGRVLRLRCAIMGAFDGDPPEGLVVQGMVTGGAWEDISLIRGWSYSNNHDAEDEITDYGGGTLVCAQDGGWVDFDIAIADRFDEVRLKVRASGGQTYRHDVALWSAELRVA